MKAKFPSFWASRRAHITIPKRDMDRIEELARYFQLPLGPVIGHLAILALKSGTNLEIAEAIWKTGGALLNEARNPVLRIVADVDDKEKGG